MAKREEYEQEDLKDKMQKITKGQKREDDDIFKKKTKLNNIGFPHDDPYGLSEAWWKIFTKPKVE